MNVCKSVNLKFTIGYTKWLYYYVIILLCFIYICYVEFVYIYECDWNYRPDHCMYMSSCKIAETNGISVLHGNRGSLHNDKQPAFKAIYDSIVQVCQYISEYYLLSLP